MLVSLNWSGPAFSVVPLEQNVAVKFGELVEEFSLLECFRDLVGVVLFGIPLKVLDRHCPVISVEHLIREADFVLVFFDVLVGFHQSFDFVARLVVDKLLLDGRVGNVHDFGAKEPREVVVRNFVRHLMFWDMLIANSATEWAVVNAPVSFSRKCFGDFVKIMIRETGDLSDVLQFTKFVLVYDFLHLLMHKFTRRSIQLLPNCPQLRILLDLDVCTRWINVGFTLDDGCTV
jgi:hypothetical protein